MTPDAVVHTPETPDPMLPSGPLKVTVTEAILMSLENNRALVVQRLNPDITQTFEDQERAVFDPAPCGEDTAIRGQEAMRLRRAVLELPDALRDELEVPKLAWYRLANPADIWPPAMASGRGPVRGRIRPAITMTIAKVASPVEKTQAVRLKTWCDIL